MEVSKKPGVPSYNHESKGENWSILALWHYRSRHQREESGYLWHLSQPWLVLRIKTWSSVITFGEQMFKGLENNFMINTPKGYYQFPLLVKA